MDPIDAGLLAELEKGVPTVSEPFSEIGRRLGIPGEEALARTRRLHDAGVIRKIRARINQRLVGITANALVAWRPPAEWDEEAFSRFASSPGISHCYLRRPVPGRWEYVLYTVHHGRSREEVLRAVEEIARAAGCGEYLVLFSTEEFKRVPNVRIGENGGDLP
ncbi:MULTISPECIES: AsnC family transcriptional regulator [unclassified Methanoculleus]|jgi:DNA-binding Lrp family transcriptional regulator|uniref:siroheme decarboxylase n=1 Tax=Methanoculleus palmolei TaxID=72612 RepID=A0ABD8A7Y2_9EURY|nr:AsnC family transcriptional regulator [Methanoculleus sp. UBA377]MDD2473383.1 AsnC family transcriptional regulator [Methanoculleus sp.]WOX55632.1 AsnC family transcriptional regulator [Methanoculleus palmolei]